MAFVICLLDYPLLCTWFFFLSLDLAATFHDLIKCGIISSCQNNLLFLHHTLPFFMKERSIIGKQPHQHYQQFQTLKQILQQSIHFEEKWRKIIKNEIFIIIETWTYSVFFYKIPLSIRWKQWDMCIYLSTMVPISSISYWCLKST